MTIIGKGHIEGFRRELKKLRERHTEFREAMEYYKGDAFINASVAVDLMKIVDKLCKKYGI